MTRLLLSLFVVSFCTLVSGLVPATAQSNDVLKEKHGDWEIRCIDGSDTCAMSQIGSTGDGKRALLVTIQRLKGATADNGISIPAAMTVQTGIAHAAFSPALTGIGFVAEGSIVRVNGVRTDYTVRIGDDYACIRRVEGGFTTAESTVAALRSREF